MTEDERPNRRRVAPIGRVQVRAEQRKAAWFLEDIGATLTIVAIFVGIVIVRLMTIG